MPFFDAGIRWIYQPMTQEKLQEYPIEQRLIFSNTGSTKDMPDCTPIFFNENISIYL